MKQLITTVLIIILLVNAGISQVFDGIAISGNFNSTLEKFKSKGYIVDELVPEGAILSFKNMQINLLKTPATNKVFKAVVYLPEMNNWIDLKSEFNKYHILFVEKYGKTSDRSNNFDLPYKEGDGKEMEALKNENCQYWSYWEAIKGASYCVEISKYHQIKITYENNVNYALKNKEASSLLKSIF
jgi:hypothetical protein